MEGLVTDQCRGSATDGGLPLPWKYDSLQQQRLAGGVSEPEESVEAVVDDREGCWRRREQQCGPVG